MTQGTRCRPSVAKAIDLCLQGDFGRYWKVEIFKLRLKSAKWPRTTLQLHVSVPSRLQVHISHDTGLSFNCGIRVESTIAGVGSGRWAPFFLYNGICESIVWSIVGTKLCGSHTQNGSKLAPVDKASEPGFASMDGKRMGRILVKMRVIEFGIG